MIMHGAHAGDIFRGDHAGLPLALVGDGAPQFGDELLNHDIDVRRPRLFGEGRDNELAYCRVAAGGRLFRRRQTDQRAPSDWPG